MSTSTVRFLADENCDFAVVRALRTRGYDVYAVAEVTNRSDDSELLTQAFREKRILLTEDKDFGWLVYVSHADSAGVILIRFPGNARESLVDTVLNLLEQHQESIPGAFVILQPGYIRIRHKS